jgi:ABC-type Fe3+ transport system permease subunit
MLATYIAILVVAAHVIAARLAERALERRLRRVLEPGSRARDPAEDTRRLVRCIDGWSVALGIAGVASTVTLFSIVGLTVGEHFWVFFAAHGPRVSNALAHTLHDAVLGSALGLVAALAMGRACARESASRRSARWIRALEHRAIVPAGLAVGFIAGYIGLRLEFGVFDISLPAVERPSLALEIALTLMCTTAVLLITAGYTMRRRRAEHARVAP